MMVASWIFTSSCTSPSSTNSTDGAVVVLDVAGHFDVRQLVRVMRRIFSEDQSILKNEQRSIEDSLQHVHVFQPTTLSSLQSTLEDLPNYLFSSRHPSMERPLAAIVVTGLNSFLWQSRADAEATQPDNMARIDAYTRTVHKLRSLRQYFSCSIIAETWGLSPPLNQQGQSRHTQAPRSHLPAVWSNCVALRLLISRTPVSRFAPGMSVEEAERDKGERRRVVDKAGFDVWICLEGGEKWGFRFSTNSKGIIEHNSGE